MVGAAIILGACGGQPAYSEPPPTIETKATPTPTETHHEPLTETLIYQPERTDEKPAVEPVAVHDGVVTAAGESQVLPLPLVADAERWTWDAIVAELARYDWPLEGAVAIVHCESGGNQFARNASSGTTGLFQLWSGWYGHAGQSADDWSNPAVNIRAAYGAYVYSGNTWRQWVCQA